MPDAYLYPDGTLASDPVPGKPHGWKVDGQLFDVLALARIPSAERRAYYPTGIVRTVPVQPEYGESGLRTICKTGDHSACWKPGCTCACHAPSADQAERES